MTATDEHPRRPVLELAFRAEQVVGPVGMCGCRRTKGDRGGWLPRPRRRGALSGASLQLVLELVAVGAVVVDGEVEGADDAFEPVVS